MEFLGCLVISQKKRVGVRPDYITCSDLPLGPPDSPQTWNDIILPVKPGPIDSHILHADRCRSPLLKNTDGY